jgi:hypothetical protein
MHQVIVWLVVMLATALLVGCGEPIGPDSAPAAESTSVVEIARKPIRTWPDTVRIPSPIPPIVVDFPPVEDSP